MRRIKELQFLQVHFFKNPQPNYGIMTSIIIHLLHNISFVIPAKHPHLTEALRDMSYEGIIQWFGMFFLQDLDPVTGELVVISQEDNKDVAYRLASHVARNKKSRNPSKPHFAQGNSDMTAKYPLGEWLTWNELVHCPDTDPTHVFSPWRWSMIQAWDEYASNLFIAFTKDMWLALDPSWLQNHFIPVTTLKEAKLFAGAGAQVSATFWNERYTQICWLTPFHPAVTHQKQASYTTTCGGCSCT